MIFVITILIIKTLALFFCCIMQNKNLIKNNFYMYYIFFGIFLAFSAIAWIFITILFFNNKIVSSELKIFTMYNGAIYGVFWFFAFLKNIKYNVFLKIGNVAFPLMAVIGFWGLIKHWVIFFIK